MIDGRVFVTLHCLNGTAIRGVAVRYSDPQDQNHYGDGAFQFEDSEGSKTYVPWRSILHLNIFDLSNGQTPPAPSGVTEATA